MADTADQLAAAIRQIESLERDPIPYVETRPRRDLAGFAYALAALSLALLVAAKLIEVDLRRTGASRIRAAASSPPRRAPWCMTTFGMPRRLLRSTSPQRAH